MLKRTKSRWSMLTYVQMLRRPTLINKWDQTGQLHLIWSQNTRGRTNKESCAVWIRMGTQNAQNKQKLLLSDVFGSLFQRRR